MQKAIFITGASTGLGRATAKLFQSKGWKVFATMRNPAKEQELSQLSNVTLLKLDVTNRQQIDEAVNKAIADGPIDVVFNNAGYGLMGPLEAISDEHIAKEINTNLLGVILVTKAFIPHFKAKRSGVFISTTSLGGLISFPFSSLYHATKWAIEGWTEAMSFELDLFDIAIKTVAPGGIQTDFATRSLDVVTHPDYAAAWEDMLKLFDNTHWSKPEQIAEVVYEAATDGKRQLLYVAGDDAKAYYGRRLEIGKEAFHQEMSEQIFTNLVS
jgi:NAD(P)-dependent dehydrogenase (short-subunit alcohol dehydrogenase family)